MTSNELKKAIGRQAFFKDHGNMMPVLIINAWIDDDLVGFNLKMQHALVDPEASPVDFEISSIKEHLRFFNNRISSSVFGWILEMDPIKVKCLDLIVKSQASVDERLFATTRLAHITEPSFLEIIDALSSLAKSCACGPSSDLNFKGQSWGGAGLMVLSDDEETQIEYKHYMGKKVITSHAKFIGQYFRKVRGIISKHPSYNYRSKHIFWSQLGEAIERVESLEDSFRPNELLAIEISSAAMLFMIKAEEKFQE